MLGRAIEVYDLEFLEVTIDGDKGVEHTVPPRPLQELKFRIGNSPDWLCWSINNYYIFLQRVIIVWTTRD